MVNLFSRRKAPAYNGFAKYTDEYNRHQLNQPSPELKRAQSLTSASQAAMAALQKHGQAPAAGAPKRQPSRANSLSYASGYRQTPGNPRPTPGGYSRTNSLQSYTYTPKASYATGPERSYSLRSNSLTGSVRGSRRQAPPIQAFAEEPEYEDDGEGDVVITTKTTKVVDSCGRTRSITTETIRALPDGSNIIETRTTNISRPVSRTNSFQGSVVNQQQANYNLRKIEEDLSDFDYTYLDQSPTRQQQPQIHSPLQTLQSPMQSQLHSPLHSPQLQPQTQVSSQMPPPQPTQPKSQPQHQQPPPPLPAQEVRPEHVESPRKSADHDQLAAQDIAKDRTNSLASTQSKRLKSILKNSASPQNLLPDALPSPQKRAESADFSPKPRDVSMSPPRLAPAPYLKPNAQSQASAHSGGNSIKFSEKVEKIPPGEHDSYNFEEIERGEEARKRQELQTNVELYNKAMEVAMKKVYGDGGGVASTPPTAQSPKEASDFTEKKSEKKLKNDEQLAKTEAAGLPRNYVYENHHKDFKIRSMRHTSGEVPTSRKDRAKEEKKQMKAEKKRYEDALKAEEKQKKKEKKKDWSFSPFKSHRKSSSATESLPISEPTEARKLETLPAISHEPSTVQEATTSQKHVSSQLPTTTKEPSVSQETVVSRAPSVFQEPSTGSQRRSLQRLVSASSQDDDEFVDVPEYIDPAAPARPAEIPVVDNAEGFSSDGFFNGVEGYSEGSADGTPNLTPAAGARGGPDAPNSGAPISGAPDLTPVAEATVTETPKYDFPTLIGGADGPVVLTSSTGDLTAIEAANFEAMNSEAVNSGAVDTEAFNSASVITEPKVDPMLDPRSEPRPEVTNAEINGPIDAKVMAGERPAGETLQKDVQEEASANGSSAINIATPQASQNPVGNEAAEKPQKKKKINKFKRVVEKYFLTTYSK